MALNHASFGNQKKLPPLQGMPAPMGEEPEQAPSGRAPEPQYMMLHTLYQPNGEGALSPITSPEKLRT